MDINFPRLECKSCHTMKHYVLERNGRWAVYCKECDHFIKWAGDYEKSIINARKAWLKEHEK